MTQNRFNRRRFLSAVTAGGVCLLAGCTEDDGENTNNSSGDESGGYFESIEVFADADTEPGSENTLHLRAELPEEHNATTVDVQSPSGESIIEDLENDTTVSPGETQKTLELLSEYRADEPLPEGEYEVVAIGNDNDILGTSTVGLSADIRVEDVFAIQQTNPSMVNGFVVVLENTGNLPGQIRHVEYEGVVDPHLNDNPTVNISEGAIDGTFDLWPDSVVEVSSFEDELQDYGSDGSRCNGETKSATITVECSPSLTVEIEVDYEVSGNIENGACEEGLVTDWEVLS